MSSTKPNTLRKFILMSVFITILLTTCESNEKLCGDRLTQTLKIVCRNKYNMVGKRAIMISDYYDDEQYAFETPFLNKLYGGVITPNVRRIKQGIVNECCKKPCSLGELSTYCVEENEKVASRMSRS